jgi:hypothetical protein
MRMTPLVGRKVWFGPRPFGGWGWQPASWEGWVVFVGWIAALIAVMAMTTGSSPAAKFAEVVGLSGLLIGIGILKGTSPGGAAEYRDFKHQRS